MDIYTVIESDHDLARMLINRIVAARSPEWRYELCRELAQVIHVHTKAKQIAYYYPLAQDERFAQRQIQIQDDYGIAESFLKEALSLDPENPNFMRLFNEARAELEQQMADETDEIFKLTRIIWDDRRASLAGQQMRALKDEFIEAEHMDNTSLRADAGYYS